MPIIRLAVIGSRGYSNYEEFKEQLEYLTQNIKEDIVYISGNCKSGADSLIVRFCKEENKELIEFPPDYIKYPGKYALFKRNDEIVNACHYLISFWDGSSNGTRYTQDKALKAGKRVKIVIIKV